MPLLEAPALGVWSHLVVDDETAANCVERNGGVRHQGAEAPT